jgi:UDP-N-acetylmuramoylalanine--D-glutamate ligase
MIRVTTFPGRTVAVFGLGASGLASALSLLEGGAAVAAWDDDRAGREAAAKAGVPVTDLRTAGWSDFAALVLAPGVPLTHPEPHWVVAKARDARVEVIGDIELFARERAKHCPDAPFIAVTGTNGKSTTTALIAHLLKELGHHVEMGGNIGRAILTLEPPAADRIHVIEVSSFQIDLTPSLHPTVGVLLNVTPDHLDRHGTVENYAAIKERLVARADAACIGVDDPWSRDIAARVEDAARLYAFTVGKGSSVVPRLYAIGTTLFLHESRGSHASSREIASLARVRSLRGVHNVQNALAALAALKALDDRLTTGRVPEPGRVWQPEAIVRALASFAGLAHRMEEIGRLGAVTFVNDSKATNADSAAKALACWEGGIYWILGGKAKAGGIVSLEPYFTRITKAYLIGEASDAFAATLDGKVPFERCGTLDVALSAAARDAAASTSPEPIVLLSPACASFDQYRNFEVRGDHFRRLVAALPGVSLGSKA